MATGNLPTQADVDAVDREIIEAKEALALLKSRRRDMLLAAWNIEPGMIVRSTGRRYTPPILGKVVSINEPCGPDRYRPWVMVLKQKKDGDFGGNPIRLFSDWERA